MRKARAATCIRAKFVQRTDNGHRECEQLGDVALTAIRLDRRKVACVKVLVPAGQVDNGLVGLLARQLELGHDTPAAQIMLVLVGLTQAWHVPRMLCVLAPFFLGIVRGPPTVRAFKVDETTLAILGHAHGARRKRANTLTARTHRGDGRLGQFVEQIIRS